LREFLDKNIALKTSKLSDLILEIEKYLIPSFDFQADMKSFLLDITGTRLMLKSEIANLANELGLDGKEEHADVNANIELSTVHGYKGLERDIIIIPWAQNFEPRDQKEIEDERRLFYVAITRAQNKLMLTYSGEEQPLFIQEMNI
jgi:superfamily I DNA/RNA helicase